MATAAPPRGAGTGNLSTDPKLGALANNGGSTQTMALLAGSSAIDTGTNTGCPATDQRGVTRPQGPRCDIGAFELARPVFTANPASWNYSWVKVATTTAGKVFTIQNTGSANLVIGTVTLAGAMPTQFHMTADTCSGQTLIPNGTCTITATFRPTTAGAKTAYINIPDNASGNPHKILLSGRGGIELALNGGFNTYPTATARIPKYWTATNFAATDGKNTAYKKEGAASVKIANTSALTKTLTETRPISGAAGNKFLLSLWGKGLNIPTTAGVVRAQVLLYYGSTLKQTATITFPNGTYGFTQKTLAFTATRAYNKIVIKLIYSKGTGAEWFDGLSLLRSP